jgi:hypothetical protein
LTSEKLIVYECSSSVLSCGWEVAKASNEAARVVGEQPGGFMRALTAASAAAQEAHQKDVRDKLIEIHSKTFSTAAAYDNAVMLGGYVAFFALWGGVQQSVTPMCRLLTAGLMAVSLMCYIAWQILQMLTRQFYEFRCAAILKNAHDPVKFNADWLKAGKDFEITGARLMRFWPFLFVPAVLFGFAGAGTLAYNALAVALGWPQLS